jgi:hypothetical protein
MVWLAVDSRTYMIGVVKRLFFGWASPDCFAFLDVAIKSELFFFYWSPYLDYSLPQWYDPSKVPNGGAHYGL